MISDSFGLRISHSISSQNLLYISFRTPSMHALTVTYSKKYTNQVKNTCQYGTGNANSFGNSIAS